MVFWGLLSQGVFAGGSSWTGRPGAPCHLPKGNLSEMGDAAPSPSISSLLVARETENS